MEKLKANPGSLACLGRGFFCSAVVKVITSWAARISTGEIGPAADTPSSDRDRELFLAVAVDPHCHVCGRADCPVVTDDRGNQWCWCRTMDIRDLCD